MMKDGPSGLQAGGTLVQGETQLLDCALTGLDPGMLAQCTSLRGPWFGSHGYCTLYCNPPADRVYLRRNTSGEITHAQYYRRISLNRLWKRIELFGPFALPDAVVEDLMDGQQAHVATIAPLTEESAIALRRSCRRATIQRVNEDVIIDLPGSPEDFWQSLDRSKRKRHSYHFRRLHRELGEAVRLVTAFGEQISAERFSALIALNRARIEKRGGRHLWTEQLMRQRLALVRQCGFLCGLERDGTLISGTLSFLHDKEGYFILTGHDSAYESLRVGVLCLGKTIEQMISMGLGRYHLLWGRSFYKTQFGGHECPLFSVTVFRDRSIEALWWLQRSTQAVFLSCRGRARALSSRLLAAVRG